MNASMIKGLIIGGVLATTGGAIAGYNMVQNSSPPVPEFADVLNVIPAVTQVAQSREECQDVEVVNQQEPRDEHRIAGTATGAIVGGLIGSQIGGGSGKKVATAVAAVAGGLAGNQIQQRAQANDTYTTVETQCEMVTEYVDQVVGYDVSYRIGETEGQIRMDQDPGETIPLVNGELPNGA